MTSPGDSTCETAVGALPLAGPDAALAHLHAIERDDAGLPFLADGAAEFAARLKADPRRLVAGFQHHRHPPRRDVRQRFDVGELDAPIA